MGLYDPRTGSKIYFIDSLRDLIELERRVGQKKGIAFLYISYIVEDLVTIMDRGKVVPQKSTWFKPKLISDSLIYKAN